MVNIRNRNSIRFQKKYMQKYPVQKYQKIVEINLNYLLKTITLTDIANIET